MSFSITNPLYTKPAQQNGTYVADQRLTVDSTAGGVQFTPYAQTYVDTVELDVQTAAVMVTFDDSAPTTTNGHQLNAGEKFTWSKARFNAAKFIRLTATSGVVHASPSSI
jgi:hypothetical protein